VDFFDPILADIGDIQSVGGDLSTFSGHMLVCREILRNARENSLILCDELGSGTYVLPFIGIWPLDFHFSSRNLLAVPTNKETRTKVSRSRKRSLKSYWRRGVELQLRRTFCS
jgi:hypothetical protein